MALKGQLQTTMEELIRDRLSKKFKTPPKWAEDFAPGALQDANIARRDFIRFLFIVSLGFFTGTFGMFLRALLKAGQAAAPIHPVWIVGREDMGIGDSHVFEIPLRREPAILVRMGRDEYVAYSQKCTHLQCPVIWKRGEEKLTCPCHKGAFSVKTGDVLYGPPKRGLPKIKLGVRPDGVYFMGMS